MLLVEQARDDADVAAEAVVGGRQGEGDDPRRVLLAVAVDAPVALLDADQAPRDVDVDEVVAALVQVDALAGDVAGDQDAHGVNPS